MMTIEFYKLMLITHRQNRSLAEYLQFIEKCVKSGVTSVQLREKNATPEFLLEYAYQLKQLLDRYHVPLIINDDIELALKVGAQGVHLGQTDGCPSNARQRLGSTRWLGLSIETADELVQANACKVDYVAASAVFPTGSKTNLRTIWGIKGLQELAKRSVHPIIAIGGINQHNTHEVITAGAQGIAVISALHDTADPGYMAAHLRQLIASSSSI